MPLPLDDLGVNIVIEGILPFEKDMKKYNKTVKKSSKETKGFASTFKNLSQEFQKSLQNITKSIPGMGGLSNIIGQISAKALVATAAVAALAIGIFKLGIRGAKVKGVLTAFTNTLIPLSNALGSSTDFLNDLRVAAGDTISTFELMRLTNVALAGTGQQVGEAFGSALPKLLEIARVQAAATGESVEFLFSSLVRGVKRASPLLIDNTGLLINITQANKAYAEELGKTVEQLTLEEKQIALLNATIESGNIAIAAAGGIQETAADKFARSGALIQNSIDSIALSVEPLLGAILDVVNFFLAGIEQATSVIGPIIGEVLKRIGGLISAVTGILGPPIQFIMNLLGDFIKFQLEVANEALKGAARIAGAIAEGLMRGANAFIFPAVIGIAQFIADFLSGFSPPKKGPLSNIDKGAANVMEAWMGGFVGAFSITPIAQVTQEVNDQLGEIGSLGIAQVESRLKGLDLALRPFQEQLKLVKDTFEAITPIADAGLRAIDRQLVRANEALAMGGETARATITALNIQKKALQDNVNLQQERVDNATLQLAVVQAAQQEERTLLEIQKNRIGTIEKAASKASKATKGAKPKAGKAGAATPEATTGAISDVGAAVESDLVNPLQGLDDLIGSLGDEFIGAIDPDVMAEFASNSATLGEELARIGEADPVGAIIGAFAGLADDLKTNLITPISDAISDAIGWFTDPSREGSLASFAAGGIGFLGNIGGSIIGWVDKNFAQKFQEGISNAIAWFTDPSLEGGLANIFQRLRDEGFGIIGGELFDTIFTWFEDNLSQPILDVVNGLMNLDDPESLAGLFQALPKVLLLATGNIGTFLIDMAFKPFIDWVFGTGEGGGLPNLIAEVGTQFGWIPVLIGTALQSIGLLAWNSLVVPLIEAFNFVLEKAEEFANQLLGNEVIQGISEAFNLAIPDQADFGRLSKDPPAVLTTPINPPANTLLSGREGGLFTGGALRTHRDEIMMSAQPFGLISQNFVRSMDMLSNTMMGGFGGGGQVISQGNNISNTTNDNRVVNINANTQKGMSAIDIANQMALAGVL